MPNVIKDNTAIGAAKTNFATKPEIPATQKVSEADWNEHRTWLLDIQSFLRGGAVGVITGPQRFVFTVTGTENGLSTFNVALPAERASVNYVARVADGGTAGGAHRDYWAPVAGYTTTQIQVKAAAPVATGDKIVIVVEDLT